MGFQLGNFAQTMHQQQEEEEEEYRTGKQGLQMLPETDLKSEKLMSNKAERNQGTRTMQSGVVPMQRRV